MSGEMIVGGALTADQVVANVQRIQEVMKRVMKKDVHYGVIPGCDKPTLYKPGSEVILTTFRIAVDPIIENLSTDDRAHYIVRTRGIHIGSGNVVGTGVGECSSDEEKYKWRAAVCDEEYDETPEDRRRMKWKKAKKPYQVKQVRANHADIANTVLKMAKKRAQIDMTLTATAASDCFAQDLEDLPEGMDGAGNGKAEIKEPQAKKPPKDNPPKDPAPEHTDNGLPKISAPQRKRFYAIWKGAGKDEVEVRDYLVATFGTDDSTKITKDGYKDACAWAESDAN